METVIALAPNLFYGTSIAVNILVLSKHKDNTDIQFIDASGLFKKETNNNVLTEEHIADIVKLFANKADVPHIAQNAAQQTVKDNGYNLAVSSYVAAKDTREIIDIAQLNADIRATVAKIDQLRREIDDVIAEIEA